MSKMECESKYFRLNENCILVKGSLNGAVYNLVSGEIYSIKRLGVLILQHCEKCHAMDSISKILKIPASRLDCFFKELQNSGLGDFYKKPVYIDNPFEFSRDDAFPTPIKLRTITLELHRECSLNCVFCMSTYWKRNKYIYCGCRQEKNSPVLSFDDIKNFVYEAKKFGLKSIYIVGGDPLSFKDSISNLLYFLKKNNISVTIHSNAANLDGYTIDLLSEMRIKLEIPVYSYKEEIHDNIVGVKNNYKKLLIVLESLLRKNIENDIVVYISEFNLNDYEDTFKFFGKFGCRQISHKFVYPTRVTKKSNQFIDLFNEIKMKLPKMDDTLFLLNKKYNYCLNQKLAITAEGNIIPCHIARNRIVGNIKRDSLSDILREGKMDSYWNLSKDKFQVCNRCEYRYACVDCTVIEHTVNLKMNAKNVYCKYNPLSGEMEAL